MNNTTSPVISVVIVSYNTCQLLEKCLNVLLKDSPEIALQIIVVDNASSDGSCELISSKFPQVTLIKSEKNLGFAAANNKGFALAKGKYVVLLNSDAFLHPGTLQNAFSKMENDPHIGLGGAQLVGLEGERQPSARPFPAFFNYFLRLSGLADKYPHSKIFGTGDGTVNGFKDARETDWVPGAFSIIRRSVLDRVGYFDEKFYFYYEEIDLCRRIKAAGYSVWYWPDVVVTHLVGGSSKSKTDSEYKANSNDKMMLWYFRSTFIYYRKYYGFVGAQVIKNIQMIWHYLRVWKNKIVDQNKVGESQRIMNLLRQAWKDTQGGRISPPTPW